MPLYVRDDEVEDLADRLAKLSRSTVTDAVRDALSRRLRGLADERDLAPGFTDKDMYDENGDPIY